MSDPAGGPCVGGPGRVAAAAAADGGPSFQESRAAAGTGSQKGCCRCWSAGGPAAPRARTGTGRFRCQRSDPAGVLSRLEPRGKALEEKETIGGLIFTAKAKPKHRNTERKSSSSLYFRTRPLIKVGSSLQQ